MWIIKLEVHCDKIVIPSAKMMDLGDFVAPEIIEAEIRISSKPEIDQISSMMDIIQKRMENDSHFSNVTVFFKSLKVE